MSASDRTLGTIETRIPGRLDRLPWSGFHWRVVIGLGTVWILDGLEVTIIGFLAPTLVAKGSGIDLANADIATDGPAIQFHHETAMKPFSVSTVGPSLTPSPERSTWKMPRGSANQLGPSIPTTERTALTTPFGLKRNSHRTVIATVAVTEGK